MRRSRELLPGRMYEGYLKSGMETDMETRMPYKLENAGQRCGTQRRGKSNAKQDRVQKHEIKKHTQDLKNL